VASQLVGKVSIDGISQAKADLSAMGDSSKLAQEKLDNLQTATKDVSSVLTNRFTAEVKNASSGMQSLSKEAEAAGLDVSKFTTLQLKASESAARFGVVQAQAAAAMEKANAMVASGKASVEQITVAQNQAALAAEKVSVAENTVGNAMSKVQSEASRLQAEMTQLSEANNKTSNSTNIFSGVLSGIKEHLGNIGSGFASAAGGVMEFAGKIGLAINGVQAVFQTAVGVGNLLIGSNASMEQTTVAFTSIFHSASLAHEELKKISDFAAATPFEFPDVAEADQKLLAFQFTTKETFPIITAIGDALSGLGKSSPAYLEQVVDVFGQMHAAGKIQTQDLMQLTSVGINGFQILADGMGKTVPQIKEMVTAGLIPADQGIELLRAGMEKTFGGGMQAQSMTFNGLLSTFKDNANAALRSFSGPLFDAAKVGLTQLGDLVSSQSFQDFAKTMGEKVGGALQSITQFITSRVIPTIANLAPVVQEIGGWFIISFKDILPLLSQIGKGIGEVFGSIAAYLSSDQFSGILADFETLGNQIIRLDLSNLKLIGPIVKDAFGILGTILTTIVLPAIDIFVFDLGRLYSFLNEGSIKAQIFKDILLGVGVAIAAIQIGAFIATIPALVAGFVAWAGAAWLAATGTIAATLPLFAIGAAIALVVAGIILAVQHWGDIMGWITGKTEQTRISVEQSHVKMRIAQDENTAKGAQAAIDNFEKERQGIIQKLLETHDATEKAELQHQLTITIHQEQGQIDRLHKADDDKKAQLAKQKELHAQMEEAQKPWIVRMGDGIKYGFQAAWQWISDRAVDAWHGIQWAFAPLGGWFNEQWHKVQTWWGGAGQWFNDVGSSMMKGITNFFGGVGQFFQDKWHDVQNWWGGAGKWFNDVGSSMYKGITGLFGNIGKWFGDRWSEITTPLKPITDYIGQVFQTTWNILVALWGKLGAKFHEWFTEAYNAVSATFASWGAWWQEKWKQTKDAFGGVGAFFHDVFKGAWDHVVEFFGFLGKWFGDRWNDTKNVLAGVAGFFHDIFQAGWNKIVEVFTPFANTFKGWWSNVVSVYNAVPGFFHDIFQAGWNKIVEVFTPLANTFKGWWSNVVSVYNAIPGFFHDIFQSAWNKIVDIFTPLAKTFKGWWDDISNGLNTFKTNAVAKFNELGTDVQNIFHNIINGIIDRLNGGVHAVVDFLNYFGKGLNDLAKALGTTGTVQTLGFSPIPHYAQGTDAHPGGLMIVGEEGPELLHAPKGTKVASNKDTKDILAAMAGGKIPGYAGGIGDIAGNIMSWVAGGAKSVLDGLISTMNIKAPDLPGMENIASGMFNKVKDWALDWIGKLLPSFMASMGGTAGTPVNVPGTVADWIKQGMALANAPANWLNDLETIALKESGGNPSAINLTDSNAQAGHPSQGLFQTIPSTFAAYAVAGHNNILNGIDNTAAAVGYIRSRYGDVFHVPGIVSLSHGGSYVGYAEGTNYAPGGMAVVGERGPELMYVPRGAQILPNSQLTSSSHGGLSNSPTIVHIHNYIDGKEMTDAIGSRLVKSARTTGPIRSNA
jgi:tape measure domain-containing protein